MKHYKSIEHIKKRQKFEFWKWQTYGKIDQNKQRNTLVNQEGKKWDINSDTIDIKKLIIEYYFKVMPIIW